MVHAPEGPVRGARPSPANRGGRVDFSITLKGWRSQLRWAMTQREEDPARVWLEVISIDERSKRALADAADAAHVGELRKFRDKLESSIRSLTDELGDDNVAPLYSWLDLVRERRRLAARIEEARRAVAQARAMRQAEGGSPPPETEDEAAAQASRAQGERDQWQAALPPEPPPAVRALWDAAGGDAQGERLPRDPMTVGKRGDEARRVLARAEGRAPGRHPWVKSRGELIAVPVAGAAALLTGLFTVVWWGSSPGAASAALVLAIASVVALGGLVGWGALARRMEAAERRAALDWTWHRFVYEERTQVAELEAGWLRALVDAQRALRTFDAKAGTGGQLRDFESWRPDLAEMVHEVARDTEGRS